MSIKNDILAFLKSIFTPKTFLAAVLGVIVLLGASFINSFFISKKYMDFLVYSEAYSFKDMLTHAMPAAGGDLDKAIAEVRHNLEAYPVPKLDTRTFTVFFELKDDKAEIIFSSNPAFTGIAPYNTFNARARRLALASRRQDKPITVLHRDRTKSFYLNSISVFEFGGRWFGARDFISLRNFVGFSSLSAFFVFGAGLLILFLGVFFIMLPFLRHVEKDREQLYDTLNAMNVSIRILDANTLKMLYANARAREFLGDMVHEIWPADWDTCDGKTDVGMEDLLNLKATQKYILYSGARGKWAEAYVSPVAFADGRRAVVEVMLDITLRHTLEGELLKAKEAAESANSAKSQFLSNMSHEIRTPMNAIIGMTRIAKNTADINKIRASLDKVEIASEHLLDIINTILDLSKIDAGKFELTRDGFDLEKTLADIISVVSVKADEKEQSLEVKIAPNVPRALIGDSMRLGQVVMNLLANAVKFTPEHGRILLEVAAGAREGRRVELDFNITDSGIGMSAEQIKNLFQAFEQADKTITKRYGGTGLGLAISKKIVNMMGGRISAQSVYGKGSSFKFNVFAEIMDGGDKVSRALPRGGEEAKKADFSGRHIMIVDDIEINREILANILHATNVKITMAADGREAVDLFKKSPNDFDLILMDVQMPGMDGYAATRAIRASGLKNVPVIALTASVFSEDVTAALAAGMNGHLIKPIDDKKLFAELAKYLTAAPKAAVPAPVAAPAEIDESYVNIKTGLRILSKNTKLYIRLLESFVKNNFMEEFAAAVANNDIKTAELKAHTIKGVAANLSLDKLKIIFEKIDARLKKAKLPEAEDMAEAAAIYARTAANVQAIIANPALAEEAKKSL